MNFSRSNTIPINLFFPETESPTKPASTFSSTNMRSIKIQHGTEWLCDDHSEFEYGDVQEITIDDLGWMLHDYPISEDGVRAAKSVGFDAFPIYRNDWDARSSGRSFIALAPGQNHRAGQLWRAVCNRYNFAK